jgi:TnpA family transposase
MGVRAKNGLAITLCKLGGIERPFFILDWLHSVDLR